MSSGLGGLDLPPDEDFDTPRIESFKELLNEIGYSWEYPNYDFIKTPEGYVLNKLYIARDRVQYKTTNWELAPGVYEQLEEFVAFLERTDEKV